jgi:putative Holliday junction resolvase
LGIDYGSKRIGLAVSDADRKIASPLTTYERKGPERDAAYFRTLIDEEEVSGLVLGLPVHLSGAEGQKAREVRAFAAWLAKATGLTPAFWDERFTTVEAEQHLLAAGLTNKRRKERRDRLAAQILLQTYLDAGCPAEESPRPLDE